MTSLTSIEDILINNGSDILPHPLTIVVQAILLIEFFG